MLTSLLTLQAKKPRLTPYLADGDRSPAVIVCPGGSYFWLDSKTEGEDVARWLQSNGISAFVLEYRVAGIPEFITHTRLLARGTRYPDMLVDLQDAIAAVRSNATAYGIDPARVGVMGFSAGGHLALMSGLFGDRPVGSAGHAGVSVRPDFVAALYPVVTMTHPATHKRSRRGLLGDNLRTDRAMLDSLSLENHVSPTAPPVFLMNCLDDPVVDPANAHLMDSALTAHGVAHRYVSYRTGGHGFGATESKTTPEAAAWKQEFLDWMRSLTATD